MKGRCELQLMDEGQKLSKRQLELEGSVKKLRQQLKASEAEREKLLALLSAESAEAEAMRRAKAKAERDLVAAVEAGRQEVEAVRQQAQADMLNTQAEQVGGLRASAEWVMLLMARVRQAWLLVKCCSAQVSIYKADSAQSSHAQVFGWQRGNEVCRSAQKHLQVHNATSS